MVISGSLDGSFCLSNIVDKDPRRKDPIPVIAPMTETIIPRAKRDTLLKQIHHLKTEIDIKRKADNLLCENAK